MAVPQTRARTRAHLCVRNKLREAGRCAFLLAMKMNRVPLLTFTIGALALTNLRAVEPVPSTPKKPVFDEYDGVKVEDPYQWLEKDDDPQVKAWSDGQSQRTRAYIDKLPDRAAI